MFAFVYDWAYKLSIISGVRKTHKIILIINYKATAGRWCLMYICLTGLLQYRVCRNIASLRSKKTACSGSYVHWRSPQCVWVGRVGQVWQYVNHYIDTSLILFSLCFSWSRCLWVVIVILLNSFVFSTWACVAS